MKAFENTEDAGHAQINTTEMKVVCIEEEANERG